MAKNKNNKFKNTNKNSARNSSKDQTKSSVKSTHAEVPDSSPGRSGPGGE